MSSANPALGALPRTRREILEQLKLRGEARAEDLASALGITVSGVRQHLTALAADDFVEYREHKGGPGRPSHRYRLSVDADRLFPKAYGELANELLGYVAEEAPDLVKAAFERRARRRLDNARKQLAGLDLDAKVPTLAAILDGDGYVTSCERNPDGSWLLVEHNCAILDVALRYGHACQTEAGFVRKLLPEAKVERTKHMVGGDHCCAYSIRPR